MGREMERLIREGDNIGSWTNKGAGFYSPQVLLQKAEELRVLAFQKYQANTRESLKEAFVMMMRFAKFHDLIRSHKGVQKDSAAFQKLRRDLLTVVDALEELKPRLLKLLGEAPAAPPPPDAADEDPPKPRDELALDMAAQLEKRWAMLQPTKRPDPPAPVPPPAAPKPTHVAGAAGAAAIAAGAAAAAMGNLGGGVPGSLAPLAGGGAAAHSRAACPSRAGRGSIARPPAGSKAPPRRRVRRRGRAATARAKGGGCTPDEICAPPTACATRDGSK